MNGSQGDLTIAIVELVSDALDTPIDELPPLSHALDLDGLEAIVSNDQSQDVTVTFPYAGLRILVHSGYTVCVRPTTADQADSIGYDPQ